MLLLSVSSGSGASGVGTACPCRRPSNNDDVQQLATSDARRSQLTKLRPSDGPVDVHCPRVISLRSILLPITGQTDAM